MSKDFEQMREKELALFIIEFNKASQLDRSFSSSKISAEEKQTYRHQLVESCLGLICKIDNETLLNSDIRNAIKKLMSTCEKISFGQAQKVVNVTLKQYCFITGKENIIGELDCPLDSLTMKGYGLKNKTMKSVNQKDYLEYQNRFEQEHAVRVYKDNAYDTNRIKYFYNEG